MTLTERQQRERDYHAEHAKNHKWYLEFDLIDGKKRRWWNAYWDTWTFINSLDLKGKRVLVVGCGDGGDAVYFAYSGAQVDAFDLSPEMVSIAREIAASQGQSVAFQVAPCEAMPYADDTFDVIYARDIFHHVDIPATMTEIRRVAKPGAMMITNEIYSHSITDTIRYSTIVDKIIYPMMRSLVYGKDKPYITEDERKMNERDIAIVRSHLSTARAKYFNFIVTRLIPDSVTFLCKCDRLMLALAGRFGRFLAGRIVVVGTLR